MSINQVDANGQTPLIRAAIKGHLQVVEYLLAQNDINLYAASQGLRDSKNGNTALHWAARHGHDKIVEALLKSGIKLNMFKPINTSALSRKVKAKVDLCDYYLRIKTQIKNHGNNYHQTSLSIFGASLIDFGFSVKQKKEAAKDLKKVILKGEDKSCLSKHQNVLENGELGFIYRRFKI